MSLASWVQKQYSWDISPWEFTLLKKGNEPNTPERFKHDILNIYYTLRSLNLIPLLQIPTNDKAQFKNGVNFISHFNVGPPMFSLRVYSRLQSHITHHQKTRARSQKHFCFTSPQVAMNRNTSFQLDWWFRVYDYWLPNKVFCSNITAVWKIMQVPVNIWYLFHANVLYFYILMSCKTQCKSFIKSSFTYINIKIIIFLTMQKNLYL